MHGGAAWNFAHWRSQKLRWSRSVYECIPWLPQLRNNIDIKASEYLRTSNLLTKSIVMILSILYNISIDNIITILLQRGKI